MKVQEKTRASLRNFREMATSSRDESRRQDLGEGNPCLDTHVVFRVSAVFVDEMDEIFLGITDVL